MLFTKKKSKMTDLAKSSEVWSCLARNAEFFEIQMISRQNKQSLEKIKVQKQKLPAFVRLSHKKNLERTKVDRDSFHPKINLRCPRAHLYSI